MNDGERGTVWCADGGTFPQWLQLEFAQAASPEKIHIVWEQEETVYHYLIEGSEDGKSWAALVDAAAAI